jgi:hypothetical protein
LPRIHSRGRFATAPVFAGRDLKADLQICRTPEFEGVCVKFVGKVPPNSRILADPTVWGPVRCRSLDCDAIVSASGSAAMPVTQSQSEKRRPRAKPPRRPVQGAEMIGVHTSKHPGVRLKHRLARRASWRPSLRLGAFARESCSDWVSHKAPCLYPQVPVLDTGTPRPEPRRHAESGA